MTDIKARPPGRLRDAPESYGAADAPLAAARAYKPAFSPETCFRILKEESYDRGWWDRELVDAFMDMMRSKGFDRARMRLEHPPLPLTPQNGEAVHQHPHPPAADTLRSPPQIDIGGAGVAAAIAPP